MDAELRFHIEARAEDLARSSGLSGEEALRQARIEFGGVERAKEECRDARGTNFLESVVHDLRFGVRMLGKNPGVTLVVVLTLALGVGANTAIFGLVNGVLLQRLPVREPEEIAALVIQTNGSPLGAFGFSYPAFAEFRQQTREFCEVFGQALAPVNFTADGHGETLSVSAVSSNYFSALGLKPGLGQLILPGEGEKLGDPATLVLGYSYWQNRFGGDPGVIGKQVRVGGKPATIVGVAPREFRGQFSIFELDAYLSLSTLFPDASPNGFWNNRDHRVMLSLGRLKPGVSLAQAQSRFDVISERLAAQYPTTDKGFRVRVMDERLSRPIPYANNAFLLFSGLFLILGALVLMLACTNIANILMARASVRHNEMAIRAALGGTRSRLIRQMLTETMLTALLGGASGVLLGLWLSRLVGAFHHTGFPVRLNFEFDWRVFGYALAAVIFTAIFAGLSPALRVTRANDNTAFHQGWRANASGPARHKVRGDLMAAQVACSLMLLVVAGLFVRSLQSVQHMDLGFEPNHLLNVRLDPALNNYSATQTDAFYTALESKVRGLPGVQSASLAASVPLSYIRGKRSIYMEGRPVPPGVQPPSVLYNSVDPAYFETLSIPLLLGRPFRDADTDSSPQVAIINETMAKRFWPKENPIGKRFRISANGGPSIEVVGLARDGKYRTLAEDPEPYLYLPLAQDFTSERVLQVRSLLSPDSVVPEVRREILALDSKAPIEDIQTMKESLEGTLGYFLFRFGASLAAAMGLIGLLLAIVGVYGVVAYAATQRTRELGIRMALGASPRQILGLLLQQGARVVSAGLLLGLVGAWALTRAMSHMLVGVSPSDPLTYFAVSALLTCVTLLACWIPARRAMRVDPMVALRYE